MIDHNEHDSKAKEVKEDAKNVTEFSALHK